MRDRLVELFSICLPECTFILLDPDLEETEATQGRGGGSSLPFSTSTRFKVQSQHTNSFSLPGAGMVGDVNLFFNNPEDRRAAEIEAWHSSDITALRGPAVARVARLHLTGGLSAGDGGRASEQGKGTGI